MVPVDGLDFNGENPVDGLYFSVAPMFEPNLKVYLKLWGVAALLSFVEVSVLKATFPGDLFFNGDELLSLMFLLLVFILVKMLIGFCNALLI